MSTALRVSLPLALASALACTAPWDPLVGCAEVDACTTSSSGGVEPNTSGEPQTVTGPSDSTSTTTGDASSTSDSSGSSGAEALPVEVEVFLTPSPMLAVGQVQVAVSTSRPVASIDLFDGDTPLALGAAPGNPVHVFEVTSDDVPGDGTHTIRAVAYAADGGSGEAAEELLIDVQPGGSDVWPPYVLAGPINGFTSAAMLGNGIAAAGFYETNQGVETVAMRIDGTKGKPEGAPVLLGPVAVTGGGRGPAVAVGADDTAFVAWTRPDQATTRWAVSRVKFGEGKEPTWIGPLHSSANAITVAGEVLVVVGAIKVGPNTHDLGVWWVSATTGGLLHAEKFAAPPTEDQTNLFDEVARGVAIVAGEVVVVGERVTKNDFNVEVRRTVVLRYSLDGTPLGTWTSPGELMDEDGAMAVAPLRAGGFAVTGWGRDLGFSNRLLLTRWFNAAGEAGPVRVEPTSSDAVGYAIGEDREGKLVLAGATMKPLADMDSWVFAIPGPIGAPAWEVVRNGPGQGPDEATGLAIDAWGYSYVVGSEFAELQPRAFALRLYP